MTFDLGAIPPEITSLRMHSGSGPATLLAAATAWDGLAAKLAAAAAAYAAVVSRLTTEEWQGPSAAAMAAAVTPYATWMNSTAARARHTAGQARAAAAAYEAAFAATVPPAAVATNRTQLRTLTATNIIGQNTPAIAATEAQYSAMWAQDAAAMYGYAESSSAATRLAPFTGPRDNTDPAGAEEAAANAAGNGQTGLAQFTSTVPATLQSLAAPAGTGGILDSPSTGGLGPNANIWNTITSSGTTNPAVVTSMMTDLAMVGTLSQGGSLGDVFGGGSFQPGGVGIGSALGATHLVGAVKPDAAVAGLGGGTGVSAGMARALPVGALSVPPAWAAAAPAAGPAATALPGHSLPAAVPQGGTPGMPGVPAGAMGGRGANGATGPRYGVQPTVMARPPSAGYAPDVV